MAFSRTSTEKGAGIQVPAQNRPLLRGIPGQAQALPLGLGGNVRVGGEDTIGIAHPQQDQLVLNHLLFQAPANVLPGEICAIDLLMPVLPRPLHGLVVVFPGEQVQIPDLGLSGHEQLDGPGQQHPAVILSQGAVVGGVDLVVDIFLAVEVLT